MIPNQHQHQSSLFVQASAPMVKGMNSSLAANYANPAAQASSKYSLT